MARPAPTSINCPNCRQPFSALLEQIIDVRRDPTSKERLLSGRVNLVTCPHCGYRGMVGTPLVYHDPEKQLAIIYVPMELSLQQTERERMIGDFTNALIKSLPEDAPKGYLLQPRSALTLQGLIDQVLEAEGITQDVLDRERRKVEIINELAEADREQRDKLLEENQDLFDLTFIELVTAAAQSAAQTGNERVALRLMNIRQHLLDTTEAGMLIKTQQEALMEASQELQSMGDRLTREGFVDMLIQAADNQPKVEALGTLGRQLLDYTTFQLITQHIERAKSPEARQKIEWIRDRLLEINAEYEQQARAVIQRAADTLRMMLQSPDIVSAVHNNLDRIDDTFLQVLQVNLEEARRGGNVEISNRLKQIRDEVLRLIQASAPPEVRFINDMLSVESENESIQILHNRATEVNEQLLEVMDNLIDQLRMGGNEPAAHRLEILRVEAESMLS